MCDVSSLPIYAVCVFYVFITVILSFTLYNVINKPTDNIQHITVYSDTEWSPMVVYLFICLFVPVHAEIR